jgi:hypothetical protein
MTSISGQGPFYFYTCKRARRIAATIAKAVAGFFIFATAPGSFAMFTAIRRAFVTAGSRRAKDW